MTLDGLRGIAEVVVGQDSDELDIEVRDVKVREGRGRRGEELAGKGEVGGDDAPALLLRADLARAH
jgi:hypothetical protein